MRKTVAVGKAAEGGFEVVRIDFELYKDRAVVKIKDDDGKTVEQYESAKAHIKDKHWLTKAQADALQPAKNN